MYCKIELPGYPGRVFNMPKIFCYQSNGNSKRTEKDVEKVIKDDVMEQMLDVCLVGVNKKKGTKKKMKLCNTVKLKDAIKKNRITKKMRSTLRKKGGVKKRKSKRKNKK